MRITSRPGASMRERFFDRAVTSEAGCWGWRGYVTNEGYTLIAYPEEGLSIVGHRLSYELHKGPIPDGLTVDHLCRNRTCTNPDHLEAVPFAVNVLRGVGPTAINAAKTHCKHGHPFDEENTYTRPKSGNRDCRKCIADRIRKSKQRKGDHQ